MDRPPSFTVEDEPVTPAGRLFLRPELDQIISAAIGLSCPMDVPVIRAAIADSMMMNHPRFSSILVVDKRGREHWRKTQINLDQHIIVRRHFDGPAAVEEAEVDSIVNDYLADFAVSRPLSRDKPLWELHLITDLRCAIWRVHHSLGDGISLMSMFLECCRIAADPTQRPEMGPPAAGRKTDSVCGGGGGGKGRWRSRRNWREKGVIGLLKLIWFTVIYVLEAAARSLWVRDKKTVLSGGDGVAFWPRKIATAKFSVDDMKAIKRAIPDSTINDVLFGMVSCGLSRYLEFRSPNAPQEGLRITGLAFVNLRKQPGIQEMANLMKTGSGIRWGNRFGYLVLPIYYHSRVTAEGAVSYVREAKKMIGRKKQSLEAHFTYIFGNIVMSCFGPKAAYWLINRITCNTTFTISNVVGPQEEITVVGNTLTYIRVITSAMSHALTLSMLSYKGRADMQIMVAKDIIPDPEFLARCFEDVLLEMKVAAEGNTTGQMEP